MKEINRSFQERLEGTFIEREMMRSIFNSILNKIPGRNEICLISKLLAVALTQGCWTYKKSYLRKIATVIQEYFKLCVCPGKWKCNAGTATC